MELMAQISRNYSGDKSRDNETKYINYQISSLRASIFNNPLFQTSSSDMAKANLGVGDGRDDLNGYVPQGVALHRNL